MLGKSRLCRHLHKVGDLIARGFLFQGLALKHISASLRYLVDSFSVALCDNIRTKCCRLVPLNEAFRGKRASKRRFFYGVCVVVVTTEAGVPVEFAFLPGAAFDARAYNNLPLALPPGSELFGDTAYVQLGLCSEQSRHKDVLASQPPLGQALFVVVAQNGIHRLAVGFLAVGPPIRPEQAAIGVDEFG